MSFISAEFSYGEGSAFYYKSIRAFPVTWGRLFRTQEGRGADSSDMGTPVTVAAGTTETRTALELGASGNKFLNVQNQSVTEGSYKVVRD